MRSHCRYKTLVGGKAIFCKMHSLQGKKILGCCDQELIGKTIRKGEIEFAVRESFYKGKKITENELKELFEEAESVNLVGKKSVEIAIKNNWIKKEDIIRIDTIPHAQIFKI